jgi:hypothetical protein
LNEVMMEFLTPLATSFLFHWPMQGPQALANTDPPAFSKIAEGHVTAKHSNSENTATQCSRCLTLDAVALNSRTHLFRARRDAENTIQSRDINWLLRLT